MWRTEAILARCQRVLVSAWRRQPGYTAPNPVRYPWQWLWDSCFHAIAWSKLGDRRALTEMESLFRGQLANGFLPNMLYHTQPRAGLWQWWTTGHSTITQAPMYGHALRVLSERGYDVRHLLAPATRAMEHLFATRLDAATGLLRVAHPWETGCDDSPRWGRWMPFGRYQRQLWNVIKFILVRTLRIEGGGAVGNRLFAACPASFNALVAFNAFELAHLTGDDVLAAKAAAVAAALEHTWQPELRTWADVAPGSGKVTSSVPTQEAFLPLLVVGNRQQLEAAWANLMDESTFRRPFGFAGVSIKEWAYNPDGYWRGGCWPPVCYMLWVAAVRQQRPERQAVAELVAAGIAGSDLAEYWNPESGAGCGASPQSWSAIVAELLDD